MKNNEKFITQEKRVIESLRNEIAKITVRANENIADCEKRIKEAEDNIEQAIRKQALED